MELLQVEFFLHDAALTSVNRKPMLPADGKRGAKRHRLTSLNNTPAYQVLTPIARRVDSIAGGGVLFSLTVYALFAPHSIAITQTASLVGLVAWCARLVANRDFRLSRTTVDVAILGFFACCVVSSFLSYDPLVSVKGLKSPAFFFAFYLVSNNISSPLFTKLAFALSRWFERLADSFSARSAKFLAFALSRWFERLAESFSPRLAKFLAFALVGSCLINVVYSAGQLAEGRGVRIDSIAEDSPLARRGLTVDDVILEADDIKVNTLADFVAIVDTGRGTVRIKYQRTEAVAEMTLRRQPLRQALASGEGLGLATSPGRNFRVTGFYSHYETYAEVLQLIAALAVGMFIAYPKKFSVRGLFLAAAFVLIAGALVMTSTRAALAGLAIAVFTIAVASARRRAIIAATASIVILAPVAIFMVERARGISVLDPQEHSTAWRLEVWREAFGIVKDHPAVGIGKGSEAKLKTSLGLYDEGRLPPGHFHSTPIQIATWWGLPALIFYVAVMTILFLAILRSTRRLKAAGEWDLWGIELGCLGALVAFNVSSLAHFNFGDGEVVMAFWLLMGLAFAVERIASESNAGSQSEHASALPTEDSSHRSPLLEPATAAEPSVQAAGAKHS